MAERSCTTCRHWVGEDRPYGPPPQCFGCCQEADFYSKWEAPDDLVTAKDEARVYWATSTEQALRRRVAELEQEAAAMQRRIEDMGREMKAFMDAMQRGP